MEQCTVGEKESVPKIETQDSGVHVTSRREMKRNGYKMEMEMIYI
jgi:hypothetical protein